MEQIARRVVVHGRVQGVFFRDTTRRRATELGVTGWARNNPDGTVEAHFEGPPEAVEAAIEFCRAGPPRAVVERVEVREREVTGAAGFQIA